MALERPLDELTEADLQDLVTNEVPEGIMLEYKEVLSLEKKEERKEFLRDVPAFANTRGGQIVYGIREDRAKGVPQELCGITVANPDQLKLRLESLIRDGTDPRIYSVQIGDPIGLENGKFGLVIRIRRSFNAPHMVVCGGDGRFYHRTSAGRERLDVTGLRTSFGMADTVAARTRAFRDERLSKIRVGDTPELLREGPKCVLHMVPFDAFTTQSQRNPLRLAGKTETRAAGRWRAASGYERSRYNLDGVVTCLPRPDNAAPTCWYTQYFRNGIIEAVNVDREGEGGSGHEGLIISEYEKHLSGTAGELLTIQRDMGVAPPIFALVTLLGVRGYTLSHRDPHVRGIVEELLGASPFREEHLVLPEVVFEDFDCDVSKQMGPAFEIVWNAAGLARENLSIE
ncbi:MAG: AlbA family DNA-binding domain-containing protein [Planctomycetota bacterium]|jgi:hypothetical protein